MKHTGNLIGGKTCKSLVSREAILSFRTLLAFIEFIAGKYYAASQTVDLLKRC